MCRQKNHGVWFGFFLACDEFGRRFDEDQLAFTNSILLGQWSVHRGSASWDDCARAFPDELCVSSFSQSGSHTMPGQHSQTTQTPPGWLNGSRDNTVCHLGAFSWHWWILSALNSLARQVIVTVCDSGICCCVHCYTCDVCRSVLTLFFCPRGLTFTWSGCYGFCARRKPTELAHSFYPLLVSVSVLIALSAVFHYINSPDNSPFSHSVLLILLCLTGPFNCISLYESLPQPWYNPLWLTGLKAPTNSLFLSTFVTVLGCWGSLSIEACLLSFVSWTQM